MKLIILAAFACCVTAYAQPTAENYKKGETALKNRSLDSAVFYFSKVLAVDGISVAPWISRAQAYLQLSRNAEAYEDATRAIELDSALHAPWYVRGVSLSKLGRHELAAADYRKAISLNPSFAPQWMNLGMVLMESGNPIPACNSWKQFLKLSPNDRQAPEVIRFIAEMSQDSVGIQDSVFSNDSNTISIRLPKSWHTNCTDDGKTLNFFVSLQPVVLPTDQFSVGCSIHHIRRISKSFDLKGNTDAPFIAALWEETVDSSYKTMFKHTQLTKERLLVNKWLGSVSEHRLQRTKNEVKIAQYRVILARTDEVLVLTLETPVEHWPAYQERFFDAIKSLAINLP